MMLGRSQTGLLPRGKAAMSSPSPTNHDRKRIAAFCRHSSIVFDTAGVPRCSSLPSLLQRQGRIRRAHYTVQGNLSAHSRDPRIHQSKCIGPSWCHTVHGPNTLCTHAVPQGSWVYLRQQALLTIRSAKKACAASGKNTKAKNISGNEQARSTVTSWVESGAARTYPKGH